MPVEQDASILNFESDFADNRRRAEQADGLSFMSQYEAEALQEQSGETSNSEPGSNPPELELEQGATFRGTLRDFGLGVSQLPRRAVRGVVGSLNEIADLGGDLVGLEAYQIPQPKKLEDSTTGDVIETIAQFAVGFKGVDKVIKAAKLGIAANTATKVGKVQKAAGAALKGAAADVVSFDEEEQRLSNILSQNKTLAPLVEAVQSEPDDSVFEAKAKQFTEGLALGAAGDALFSGVKALRKIRKANQNLDLEVPPEPQIGKEHFASLGDPDNESFILKKSSGQSKLDKAAKETADISAEDAAGLKDGVERTVDASKNTQEIQINFARINAPNDVKAAIDQLANDERLIDSIQKERRGVRPNKQTQAAADKIGTQGSFDQLIERRTGDAFNAEQIVAARTLYNDSTQKLLELADVAARPEASDIDVFNFRKMVATHHAIQKEVLGVRAEAGRALQAWSIPTGVTTRGLKDIEQILAEFGGTEASKDLARTLAANKDRLSADAINVLTQKGALARTVEAVAEARTLGLLTNPQTHIVNLAGNASTAVTLGIERALASTRGNVEIGEALQYFHSFMQSNKEALANAAEAFRTGQTGFGLGKIDLPPVRATSQDQLNATGVFKPFGLAIDHYGQFLSKYVGGSLAAGDEYFKTQLYKAQLRSLAFREGREKGLQGADLKKHIATAVNDPSPRLRADAQEFALYGTHTRNLGKAGQNFQSLVAQVPGARFLVPFIRTPVNIFKFNFERTPLALLNSKIRQDITAGGIRADQALTRIGLGTSFLFMGTDLAMDGRITGGGPPDGRLQASLRRTGWQPYSVKVGDKYVSYARMEPFATWLGMSADFAEILTNYEPYDLEMQDNTERLATAAVSALSSQVVGKTFLQGVADTASVLADPDRRAEEFINQFTGSFVPAGVAAIERAEDPSLNYVFDQMAAIKSRIPGMSADLPKRYNVWGEEIKLNYYDDKGLPKEADAIVAFLNPFYVSKKRNDPVDKFLMENGFQFGPPPKVQQFDGVPINLRDYPQIYADLVRIRGAEVTLPKYGDVTMREFFEDLIADESPRSLVFFNDFTDRDEQQQFVRNVVSDYTTAAKQAIRDQYPIIDQIVSQETVAVEEFNQNRRPEEVFQLFNE